MRNVYEFLIPALWTAWIVYWFIAARGAKAVRRRETVGSRLTHGVPLVVAILLLAPSHLANQALAARFLPRTVTGFWIGAILVASGLSFSVIARLYLGGNWSGTVTLKQDHTLIQSGPYRFARHPIYTGLLLAIAGSAIAEGEMRAILALALIVWAFLWKIRAEEQFMLEQFGDAYARYRQRVAALIPGVI